MELIRKKFLPLSDRQATKLGQQKAILFILCCTCFKLLKSKLLRTPIRTKNSRQRRVQSQTYGEMVLHILLPL